jgi:hypothetical protein
MQYERHPQTPMSPRECAACDICDPGYIKVFCNDGKRNSICVDCPPGYFTTTTNALVCKQWQECPNHYEETVAPSITNDRTCAPLSFEAEEITAVAVASMAKRLVFVDLATRVRGLDGVLPFLFTASEEPSGSYMVGTSLFLAYPVAGTYSFVASVYDKAGRAFNSRVEVAVSAPLALTMENGTTLAVLECYRDRPCDAPALFATGGWPPLNITLVSAVPTGLSFANGEFTGTVTAADGVVPLTLLVTDSQGFEMTTTAFMQVSAHPSTFVEPLAATNKGNSSLLPIIGGAAAGGLLLVIIVALLVIRSRRDTSINGIMMVKNPMFLPMAAMDRYGYLDSEEDNGDGDRVGGIATSEQAAMFNPTKSPADYLHVGSNADDKDSLGSNFDDNTLQPENTATGTTDKSHYAFAAAENANNGTGTKDRSLYAFAAGGGGGGETGSHGSDATGTTSVPDYHNVDGDTDAASPTLAPPGGYAVVDSELEGPDDFMTVQFGAVNVPGVVFPSDEEHGSTEPGGSSLVQPSMFEMVDEKIPLGFADE